MPYTHPWFLLMKKNLIIHCHFLMFWSKNLTKSFLPQLTENPTSQDSVHAGINLDQRRGQQRPKKTKALLFIKLLKFALQKSFDVKSAKSRISHDKTAIQKKLSGIKKEFRNKKGDFQLSNI